MKPEITFEEFMVMADQLDIRIGTINHVEFLPKNKKMLNLTVSFGDEDRTVITNIGDKIDNPIETLTGIQAPFIMNLPPRAVSGIVSSAMIMVAEKDGKIQVGPIVTNGAKLL